MARAWTRDELIVALNLYSRLTFGQLHARNPPGHRIGWEDGSQPKFAGDEAVQYRMTP